MNDKVKILIVDDDVSTTETLEDILIVKGYEVVKAESGFAAIERVKDNGIKVVLMDFKMPGMNGVEAFHEVIKINPDLKIIFMTAYYNEDVMKKALSDGAIGIFHKPIKVDTLLNEIKAACL